MDESSPTEPAEQETARRRFLKLAVGALAAVNGLVLGIPVVAALFGPARKKKKARSPFNSLENELIQDEKKE